MTQSRSTRRFARLVTQALEDRCTPAFFGAIDNSVNVGANPVAVTIGDFDRDGNPDLAVANYSSNDVSVLLGNGDGTLHSNATISVGSNPVDIVTGDFNGDGRLDLAVTVLSPITNSVSILMGDGTGNFSFGPGGTVPVGVNPRAIAVADFDRDGRLDFAVANNGDHNISVALGRGDGTFGATVQFACGLSPNDIATGDFDGDGLLDLVTSNTGSSNVTVLLGQGTGQFGPMISSSPGQTPATLVTADFDRDGFLDLVVTHGGVGTVSMLLGENTGHFAFSESFNIGTTPIHLAAGDINADGLMDVVVADIIANKFVTALGDGNGRINKVRNSPFAAGINPSEVAIGDLNRDGALDVVCANYGSNNVTISLNRGATITEVSSSAIQAVYGQAITLRATVTTFDGFSATGIVTFRSGNTVLGTAPVVDGSASISFPASDPLDVGSYSITARYTGDSHICTAARHMTQIVTKASTSITAIGPLGTPTAGQQVLLKAVVTGVDPALLSGQVVFRDDDKVIGTVPLVGDTATLPWTFKTTGKHEYIVQYRESDFAFASISQVNPVIVVGTAQKLVTGAGPGAGPHVKVFSTDGTLERSFFAYGPTFKGGVRVATGDVTGDGVDDIVVAPGAGGGPLVRVFNGSTGIEIRSFFAYSPVFRGGVFVAAGDVNGDGRADIITAPGATSNLVRVFSGVNGAELFNLQAYPATFRGGVRVAVGDVNGDDGADIIVGPGRGPTQKVRVFNGKGSTHNELFSFLPFDAKFTGGVTVAAGDVNGDGKADVIVGSGLGMSPSVRVVSGETQQDEYPPFAPFDATLKGGLSVAATDWDGDGKLDIIVAPGAGGGPHVKVFSGIDISVELQSFFAFDPSYLGGGFVG